jgi:ATP adenylyltransferase
MTAMASGSSASGSSGSPASSGLERMWAGWRSAYVAAAGNGELAGEGSVFRRILDSGASDEDAHIVWRGELVFAILNAYPYTPGHLLVMPYREVGELEGLTADESDQLWAAVRDAVAAVKAAYRPHGINVGLNLGEAAGAGVPSHLHVHVLPRWNADSNFMTAVAEARVLPESLGDTWRKLQVAWPRRAREP